MTRLESGALRFVIDFRVWELAVAGGCQFKPPESAHTGKKEWIDTALPIELRRGAQSTALE